MAHEIKPRKVATIDCSGSPDYPEATAGDWYVVSVAGKIGGASGLDVFIGDVIFCLTDTVAGAQSTVGSKWGLRGYPVAYVTGNLTFTKETNHSINVAASTTADTDGANLSISSANGSGTGASGALTIFSGQPEADGGGASGAVTIESFEGATGTSTTDGGASGAVTIRSNDGGAKTGTGDADGGAGGDLAFTGGAGGATAATSGGVGGAGATLTFSAGAGGAASAGTSDGGAAGSLIFVPAAGGTSAGGTAGKDGGIILRKNPLIKSTATAMTDSATMTAAGIASGLIAGTPTGAANYTMPTGAVLEAGLPADIATGDSIEWSIVNLATNDTFDITILTAASGITLKFSNVVIEADSATTKINWGRFRAVRTNGNTFDVYRVG